MYILDHGWMELLRRALRGPALHLAGNRAERAEAPLSLAGLRAAGLAVVFLSVTAPPVRTLQVVAGEFVDTSYSYAVWMAC
jgi:hypothetical protein